MGEKSGEQWDDMGFFDLWLNKQFAMENGPFIDCLPIKNGDFL